MQKVKHSQSYSYVNQNMPNKNIYIFMVRKYLVNAKNVNENKTHQTWSEVRSGKQRGVGISEGHTDGFSCDLFIVFYGNFE